MTARRLDEQAGPVVALLSHRPFAWFTDVDGTLSPIVQDPAEATVPPTLRALAERLARRVDHFVVVSGRTPRHAREMVGVRRALYVGNHGLARLERERETLIPEAEPYVAKVARLERELAETLAVEGLVVENKGPILALHYRAAPDPAAARESILAAARVHAAGLGMHVHEGRKVVELRPPINRDKGAAVHEVVSTMGVHGAVYVGDDLTDIDAFRALRALRETGGLRAISIAAAAPEVDARVLREADFRVEGVEGVERLMAAVVRVLETGER
ncbi:MAG TPA: trehalose-phosphatase [Dehalococcoidia bacterium]|nr:trehalose-phosphatase [Dehalococcoidia bacterium]